MPNESLRVPIFCPLCSSLMKGKSTTTFYQFGVCISCFIEFIEDRVERWKSGWRPSKEQVDAYVERLSKSLD